MIHVYGLFWPYNSMVTLVWLSKALFKFSAKDRPRSGQKAQIIKFINVDKKCVYLDQFWLRI